MHLPLLPLLAMLGASCTMGCSNLAMRWVTRQGGRPLQVLIALFLGALAPIAALYLYTRPALAPLALLLGGIAGGTALAASATWLVAMRYGKVGPSTLMLIMAAGAPVALAAAFRWDGGLTLMRMVGLAAAIVAVGLITLQPEADAAGASRLRWAAWAFAALLLNGINQTCQKLLSVVQLGGQTMAFNLGYFVGGLLVGGLAIALLRGQAVPEPQVRRREWQVGLGFGLAIAAQMFLLIYAVSHLPAAIAFPTLAILPLILVILGATLFFNERLTTREKAGVLVACASLVLLNL